MKAVFVLSVFLPLLFAPSLGFRIRIPGLNPLQHSLPTEYTCEGANISPPLVWEGAPNRTMSYLLTVQDMNSAPIPGFVNWVVANIPSTVHYLEQGVKIDPRDTIKEGLNGHVIAGYTGPCSPASQHRFLFRLYALRTPSIDLPVDKGFTLKDVWPLVHSRIIGKPAELNVVFAGSKSSSHAGCDHSPQLHSGPPPAPIPPPQSQQQQQQQQQQQAASNSNTNNNNIVNSVVLPPRPEPALVAAASKDNSLVGGGLSISNPNDRRATALLMRRHVLTQTQPA